MKLRRFEGVLSQHDEATAPLPWWRRLWQWWRDASRYDTWNVGIATLRGPLRDVSELTQLENIRWLPSRRPLFYFADPFPYEHDGRRWLLVEAYGHPKGIRGRIARIDPDNPQPESTRRTMIARGTTHLSYPFTFADETGTMCCVPEMQQERDGCIVYALQPDGTWYPRHHILRGRDIVDPTIFRHDQRWWLLCGNDLGAGSQALDAYWATALDGPWTPHALNPVKTDASSARPAGRPFTIGGRLFRPAMDCSETYGGAVQVMEVLELTPGSFRERAAARIEPNPSWPYPHGVHHLVVDGTRVYIDAKRRRHDNLLWLKNWIARGDADGGHG